MAVFRHSHTYHILELVVYIKIPYDPHYIPDLHHFSEDKVLLWTDSKRHRMVVGRILGLGCWWSRSSCRGCHQILGSLGSWHGSWLNNEAPKLKWKPLIWRCFFFPFIYLCFTFLDFSLWADTVPFFLTEVNPASVEFQDYCPSVLLTLKDGWRKARSSRPGAWHPSWPPSGRVFRFANRLMSKELLLKSAWQNTSIIGSLTCPWLLLLDFPLAAKNMAIATEYPNLGYLVFGCFRYPKL